jgi:GNAT superfamily N-acetyltransferase
MTEPAIVVADYWQRLGLGTALLEQLTARAREEGVTCFSAVLLAENRDAIGLFENLGDATCEQSGSELRVDVELPGPRLRELLRATAAGILRFAREDG